MKLLILQAVTTSSCVSRIVLVCGRGEAGCGLRPVAVQQLEGSCAYGNVTCCIAGGLKLRHQSVSYRMNGFISGRERIVLTYPLLHIDIGETA